MRIGRRCGMGLASVTMSAMVSISVAMPSWFVGAFFCFGFFVFCGFIGVLIAQRYGKRRTGNRLTLGCGLRGVYKRMFFERLAFKYHYQFITDKTHVSGKAYLDNSSSTTHTPALSLPSCLMMPAFCIADKFLSIVREVTDKVSNICLAETEGFDWMIETITR